MTRRLAVVLSFLTLSTAAGFAQAPAPATPPAAQPGAAQPPARGGRGGGAPIKSPEVAADGRVTFRLRAPMAKEVVVTMGTTRLPMEKNEQGVWAASSDVLVQAFRYVFATCGLVLCAGLVLLILLEERPLRGPTPPLQGAAAAH